MNYKLNYGFQVVPSVYDFVYTPLTQKVMFSFVSTLAQNSFALLSSQTMTGKTHTVKKFASLMGKELFIRDCQSMTDYQKLKLSICGAAAGGYWMLFDNLG